MLTPFLQKKILETFRDEIKKQENNPFIINEILETFLLAYRQEKSLQQKIIQEKTKIFKRHFSDKIYTQLKAHQINEQEYGKFLKSVIEKTYEQLLNTPIEKFNSLIFNIIHQKIVTEKIKTAKEIGNDYINGLQKQLNNISRTPKLELNSVVIRIINHHRKELRFISENINTRNIMQEVFGTLNKPVMAFLMIFSLIMLYFTDKFSFLYSMTASLFAGVLFHSLYGKLYLSVGEKISKANIENLHGKVLKNILKLNLIETPKYENVDENKNESAFVPYFKIETSPDYENEITKPQSSYAHFASQGLSPQEIKDLKNQGKEEKEEQEEKPNSQLNKNTKTEIITWGNGLIKSDMNEAKSIRNKHDTRSSYSLYLQEYKDDFKQIAKEPKFWAEGDMVGIRGLTPPLSGKQNGKSIPLTWEVKIPGKQRILCYELSSDQKGGGVLIVGAVHLPKGVHKIKVAQKIYTIPSLAYNPRPIDSEESNNNNNSSKTFR